MEGICSIYNNYGCIHSINGRWLSCLPISIIDTKAYLLHLDPLADVQTNVGIVNLIDCSLESYQKQLCMDYIRIKVLLFELIQRVLPVTIGG
jgi:hypothetical protein